MIMVLRRWFIPSDKLEEFRERWRIEIKPELQRQPGCIRIEIYESSIRGHWVTSVLWRGEDFRIGALQQLSGPLNPLWENEQFVVEGHSPPPRRQKLPH